MMTAKSLFAGAAAFACLASAAQAAPVTFSKLTGVTGDPAASGTAVFKADLTSAGLASISSLLISDSGVLGASAPGQFSGFDLDAVIISSVDCATAACVAALTSDVVFNYASAIFSPGTQTAPTDPKLFGTNGLGTGVDDAVATLGVFDGFSSTLTPDGFLSLGVTGSIGFNFAVPLTIAAPLFLYIGEVGDNGELAAGGIELFVDPLPEIPLPAAAPLFLAGLAGLGLRARARRKA